MFALELTHSPTLLRKTGGESFNLVAGQSLKIESSPNGEELLVAEVPAGKKWTVSVSVSTVETDA
jgi:hypothetical protein